MAGLVATPLVIASDWGVLAWAAAVLLAAGAAVHGARLQAATERGSWRLLSAGMFAWAAGELTWDWLALVEHVPVPFPSWADVGYLGSVPLLALALIGFARTDSRSPYRLRVLDLVVICLGAGAAIWILVGPDPVAAVSRAEELILLVYPTADLLLVGLTAFAVVAAGRSTRFALLGAGFASLVAADVGFAHLVQRGAFETGETMSVLWPIGFGLMGAASLLPGSADVGWGERARSRALPGMLLASVVAGPVAAILAGRSSHLGDATLLVTETTIAVLVLARLTLVSRDLERVTDDLRAAHHLVDVSNARRGMLLQRLDDAIEELRTTIAHELHDGPIQDLAAVMYRLEAAATTRPPDERDRAESAAGELGTVIADLRRIMSTLRPPALDERGLGEAITDLGGMLRERSGEVVSVRVDAAHELSPEVQGLLYRLVQESLANITAHANARAVSVALSVEGGDAWLRIEDDGEGFDDAELAAATADGRFGLAAMRERVELAGGTWRVRSRRGRGTCVEARVPRLRVRAGRAS